MADIEHLSRLGRAALRHFERSLDRPALDLGQRHSGNHRARVGCVDGLRARGQVLGRDGRAIAEDHRALDRVFEFADVARPRIAHQRPERGIVEPRGVDLVLVRVLLEEMRREGYTLGGEQSGHIVLSDYSTTGDGLMAALHILGMLKESGKKASEALSLFEPLPQILKNVRFEAGKPLEEDAVKAAIAQAEETLSNDGRLLVRASGTEPVIRVMAEGDDAQQVEAVVDEVCDVIQSSVS